MSGRCLAEMRCDFRPLTPQGACVVSIPATRDTAIPLATIQTLYGDSVAADFVVSSRKRRFRRRSAQPIAIAMTAADKVSEGIHRTINVLE